MKKMTKKFKKLENFIKINDHLEDRKGSLMGVLHKTQDIFGCISKEAIEFISPRLSVPTSHIYGMVTFYSHFSLKPKARYQICVCKGTACYVAGGIRILSKLKAELGIEAGGMTSDGLFGLSITRCLGCCALSPVIQVNDNIYVRMVPEKIPAILSKYRLLDKKRRLKKRNPAKPKK